MSEPKSTKSTLSSRDSTALTKIASAMIVIARDIRNHDTEHRKENIDALVAGANVLALILESSDIDCDCAICTMQREHPAPSSSN